MNLIQYQNFVKSRTRLENSRLKEDFLTQTLLLGAMGLSGETGEVLDALGTLTFGKVDEAALKLELGDVLWYITLLADAHGTSLYKLVMETVLMNYAECDEGALIHHSAKILEWHKKYFLHGKVKDYGEVLNHLKYCVACVINIATDLDLTLIDIIRANVEKLEGRDRRGQ